MAVVNYSFFFKYKQLNVLPQCVVTSRCRQASSRSDWSPSSFRIQIISLDGRHTNICPTLHGGAVRVTQTLDFCSKNSPKLFFVFMDVFKKCIILFIKLQSRHGPSPWRSSVG